MPLHHSLLYWSTYFRRWRRNLRRSRIYEATCCCHLTKCHGQLKLLDKGRSRIVWKDLTDIRYCSTCLDEMAVLCGECKKPIVPGERVLQSALTDDEESDSPRRLICQSCLELFCDGTGRWTERGYRQEDFNKLYGGREVVGVSIFPRPWYEK